MREIDGLNITERKHILKRFLFSRGIHTMFMKHLRREHQLARGDYNTVLKFVGFGHATITYAFDWDCSDEGFDFWSNVCSEYERFYANEYVKRCVPIST